MDQGPTTDPDLELLQAVARGEAGAMEELIARFQARLQGFLQRYLDDVAAAQDLTQETLLRVWRAAPGFQPRARVSTWVHGIAYRLAMTELKRRGRWLGLARRLGEALHPASSPGPWEALQHGESARRLDQALGCLPPRQRAALLLRVDQEMSYAQISEVMGVGVSSVESLIHRARTKLRQALAAEERS